MKLLLSGIKKIEVFKPRKIPCLHMCEIFIWINGESILHLTGDTLDSVTPTMREEHHPE